MSKITSARLRELVTELFLDIYVDCIHIYRPAAFSLYLLLVLDCGVALGFTLTHTHTPDWASHPSNDLVRYLTSVTEETRNS